MLRREAAQLFDQVAGIHHTLGQAAKAAEAWGRRASLLSSLLDDEPGNNAIRIASLAQPSVAGQCTSRPGQGAEKPGNPMTRRPGFRNGCCKTTPTNPCYQLALSQHPAQHGRPAIVGWPRR